MSVQQREEELFDLLQRSGFKKRSHRTSMMDFREESFDFGNYVVITLNENGYIDVEIVDKLDIDKSRYYYVKRMDKSSFKMRIYASTYPVAPERIFEFKIGIDKLGKLINTFDVFKQGAIL